MTNTKDVSPEGSKLMAEDYSDSDVFLVGCIPLSAFPDPPEDQQDCKVIDCQACKKPMWISIKKRKLVATLPPEKTQILCFMCIAIKQAVTKALAETFSFEHSECIIDLLTGKEVK